MKLLLSNYKTKDLNTSGFIETTSMGRTKGSGLKRAVTKSAWLGIMETVREVAGEEALPVVDYLKDKRNISEFQIAEGISAQVGWVRQMLYRLQNQNLVTYFRKKDRIKGWYISYWTFSPSSAKFLAVKINEVKIGDVRERLEREEKYQNLFYLCPSLCSRMIFEDAADIDFKCPECGTVMKHQDNSKTIERLRERVKELAKGKT